MMLLGSAMTTSALLFGLGAWLLSRARVPPPANLRSESGRSPGEYAFRARNANWRRRGEFALLAGVINLLVMIVVGVLYLASAPQ